MKIITALVAFLGVVVITVVSMVAASILNGYVLSVLWTWFMVPVFHLPRLSIAPAIGIAMVVGYLTSQMHPDCQEKERTAGVKIARDAAYLLGRPLLALLFGWIVHLFM